MIESLQVNHIDGNPANNHIDNLEQVTGSENMLHSFRELGRDAVIGNFKIDHAIADQIREDRKKGLKYRELQTKYGLAKSTISCIINLKTWK